MFCSDNYNYVFPDIAEKEFSKKVQKQNFKLESNFVESAMIFSTVGDDDYDDHRTTTTDCGYKSVGTTRIFLVIFFIYKMIL